MKFIFAQVISWGVLIGIQGYDFDGYERTVDTHIKNLRRKIAAMLPDQEIICSVHGIGYKLKVHQEEE